ncbi:MAG: hypothetical protein ACQES1_01570 [Bacteroidota bacterium]
MEKIRTIYRLRVLRGGLLLSVLSVLWGLGLLTVLRIFPGIVTSHIKSLIFKAHNITTEVQMDAVQYKLYQANSLYMDASLQAILLGVLGIVVMLLVIRLNGNNQVKIIIAWLLGIGVVLYSTGIFLDAVNFVGSGAVSIEHTNNPWAVVPGCILFFSGFLLSVIKILKDLTSPVTVD